MWMQELGHSRFVCQRTLMWVGAIATFGALYFITSELGLVRRPGESIVDWVIPGILAGCIWGELEWTYLKRKIFVRKPNEDPTMI